MIRLVGMLCLCIGMGMHSSLESKFARALTLMQSQVLSVIFCQVALSIPQVGYGLPQQYHMLARRQRICGSLKDLGLTTAMKRLLLAN
eukprot:131414-Amphidinium_carterae.1